MKITLYSIMVVLICFSCKKRNIIEKSSVGKAVSISQITTNYDTLIKRVVNKGDVDSYN